jgi:hypothetical protein
VPGLLERRLDTVGDERERRVRQRERIALVVDLGADVGQLFHDDRRARVDRAAVHAMRLAEGSELEGPPVQRFAA